MKGRRLLSANLFFTLIKNENGQVSSINGKSYTFNLHLYPPRTVDIEFKMDKWSAIRVMLYFSG